MATDTRQGRAVVLTALGLEYQAVRTWMANPRLVVHPSGTRYETGRLNDPEASWQVALAEIGEGNQNAAVLTGQAISQFDPDVVLFVGIAGGLTDWVRLGDVVAATRVDAYHGGKVIGTQFMARPVTWPTAAMLEQAARQVARERRWLDRLGDPPAAIAEEFARRPPEVYLKPVLAGEVVVDSRESKLYRFLRQHYNDAVAVEMEGAGLASAAHASGGKSAMVIRGISDLAGGEKAQTDAAGWQPLAARHAAAFAVELLVALRPEHLPPHASRAEWHGEPDAERLPPVLFELRGHERLGSFIGRDELLRQLHDMLASSRGPAALVVLHGPGGVGKTQLAVEYAHRHRHEHDIVWWVRAEDPVTTLQDYVALAGPLGLSDAGRPDAEVVEAVRAWLGDHDRWLLIFDDAAEDETLAGLLPEQLRGHVLVTSRNPLWRQRSQPLRVDVFTPEEAVRFLRTRTGQDDPVTAAVLAGELGCLPLALDQAGAYVDQTGVSLADYLGRLRVAEARMPTKGQGADQRTSAAAWELFVGQVQLEAPAAAQLLNLLAFLAPEDLPRELLHGLAEAQGLPEALREAAADPPALNEAVVVLRRYSLIDTYGEMLRVHWLVQAITRQHLARPDAATWSTVAVELLSRALPEPTPETWPIHERLLPHSLAVIDHAKEHEVAPTARERLLTKVGRYLQQRAGSPRPRRRRTLAVLAAALLAVAVVAAVIILPRNGGSGRQHWVGMDGDRVAVFEGRAGDVAGSRIVERTLVRRDDVADSSAELSTGIRASNLEHARQIANCAVLSFPMTCLFALTASSTGIKATSASTTTPPPGSKVLEDDFSSRRNSWSLENSETTGKQYLNGAYRILVKKPEYAIFGTPEILDEELAALADVRVEVAAGKIGGADENQYGVICRYKDVDNYYVVHISNNGHYAFEQHLRGEWLLLKDGPTDVVKSTAMNHIRVDCAGGRGGQPVRLTLWVNGQRIGGVTDRSDAFSSGGVGLLVASVQQPTDVIFDDVAVWKT